MKFYRLPINCIILVGAGEEKSGFFLKFFNLLMCSLGFVS